MNQVISKEDFDIFTKKITKENKEFEIYSDDEYANDYYPYNKSKNNSKLEVIIDESNRVSFEIISHSFKNGYFNFTVKHEMYEGFITIDMRYFNSYEKYVELNNYFRRIFEKSECKIPIRIDYEVAIKKWISLFRDKINENGFYQYQYPLRAWDLHQRYGKKVLEKFPELTLLEDNSDKPLSNDIYKKSKLEFQKIKKRYSNKKLNCIQGEFKKMITSINNGLFIKTDELIIIKDVIRSNKSCINSALGKHKKGMLEYACHFYGTLKEIQELQIKICFAVFIWKKKSRCITFVDNQMYLKPPKYYDCLCEEKLNFWILELKLHEVNQSNNSKPNFEINK